MESGKRFYTVRRVPEGMGGGSTFHAVLTEEPEPALNLTVCEVAPTTEPFDWRLREPAEKEPPV